MAYNPLPIKEVGLDSLMLDLENYRIPTRRKDEAGALKYLFDSEDVIGAMKSILKNGYFDNEVPIVAPASEMEEKQMYIVLEGNRRVSALKSLHDPTIVPEHEKEIRKLLKRYEIEMQNLPMVIRVLVAPDRETAAPHVARLHTGRSKKPWTLDQQATFYYSLLDEQTTVDDVKIRYPDVNVVRFMKMAVMRRFLNAVSFNDMNLSSYVNGDELKMSAFEYAYKIKEVADAIGVAFDENGLFLPSGSTPEETAAKLTAGKIAVLEYLLVEFREKRLNTRSPELKKSSERYSSFLDKLSHIGNVEGYQSSKAFGSKPTSNAYESDRTLGVEQGRSDTGAIDAHDAPKRASESGESGRQGTQDKVSRHRTSHPDKRSKLDLSGLEYDKTSVNLKCRYIELSKVNIIELPVAAAILLRSILETTIKASFENEGTPASGELKKVFIMVEDKYGKDKALKNAINTIKSGGIQKFGSIAWFNYAAHNVDAVINADDVRKAWRRVNPLLRRMLQSLPEVSTARL